MDPITRILLFGGHYIDVAGKIEDVNQVLVTAYEAKKNAAFTDVRYRDGKDGWTSTKAVVSPEKIAGLVEIF